MPDGRVPGQSIGDPTPYVFVSYASADRDRMLPVVEALRRAGVPVWLD